MNAETVTITVKEYERLKMSASVLYALQFYGVSNWEPYGEAMQSLGQDTDEEGNEV